MKVDIALRLGRRSDWCHEKDRLLCAGLVLDKRLRLSDGDCAMRSSTLLLAAALLAASVAANAASPDTACVNPSSSYRVRWLEAHDLLAVNTLGSGHKEVRLTTSCIGLGKTYSFSLGSTGTCVGQGDPVVATSIDGRRQQCVITGVALYIAPPPQTPN
jgi:hypothetical protein